VLLRDVETAGRQRQSEYQSWITFGTLHRHNVGMIRRVLLASKEPTAPVANGAAWQKVPTAQNW
jgi:hypothetical protein